jgi:hypothetical protein
MATKKDKSPQNHTNSKHTKDVTPKAAAGKGDRKNDIDSIFAEKKRKKEDDAARQITRKKKPKYESSSSGGKGGNLSVLEKEFGPVASSNKWKDDGLGGKFNSEGYTGRVEDGVKVFKAHMLNKPNFGSSKDCPFECQCCFI